MHERLIVSGPQRWTRRNRINPCIYQRPENPRALGIRRIELSVPLLPDPPIRLMGLKVKKALSWAIWRLVILMAPVS
jgi:hypothetical protein